MQQRYTLCARLSTNAIEPCGVERDASFVESPVSTLATIDHVISFRF